ncbi:MAG: class F sortase [Ornithinimicrobium sp.]
MTDRRAILQRRVHAGFALLAVVGLSVIIGAAFSQEKSAPMPDESAGLTVSSAELGDTEVNSAAELPSNSAPARSAMEQTVAQAAQRILGDAEAPEPLAQSLPATMDIPSVDIESDLHPVGKNKDGTLEVPSGPLYDQAAWYDGSPTPGELGPSVLLGHVTSQGSTPSIFFELGATSVGDVVEVGREDGSTAIFEVYAVDSYPKDQFPTDLVYGNTETPELRVITCGGDYDADERAHVDNIVVYARLTASN